MIDESSEVRRLLSVLRERPHSVQLERAEARKARVVPALQAQVKHLAEKRARSVRRRFFVFAAAAVVFAFVLGVGITRYPGVRSSNAAILAVNGHLVHHSDGTLRPVAAGDRLTLPVAGELRADPGVPATLETAEGLEMRLEGGSRLALGGMSSQGAERSVQLSEGQIRCAVPKLTNGAHFAVITPNAKVVVHGTRFTVRVDSPSAGVTRTCVRVSEGVVAVHHSAGDATLRAGDEWGCRPEAREPPKDTAVTQAAPAPSPRVARRALSQRAVVERAEGTLAEETTLLQTALAAERKGQRGAATTALMRLLSRYPDSPLAPEARTVLERVSRPTKGP
jgi:ferric-dicitrate binding protein FerR (iron transport regulator)